MAIHPTGRLANVLASFENYLQTTLGAIDSVFIAFPGVPFETEGLLSWTEINYLGDTTTQKWRQTGGRRKGREADLIVQVTCYCKKNDPVTGDPTNRKVLYNLRDLVVGRLQLGREIDIADWHNASSAMVDTMQVQGLEDQPLVVSGDVGIAADSDKELLGWVYTVTIRYTELLGAS